MLLGVHGKPQWARHNADTMGLATASVLPTHTPFESTPGIRALVMAVGYHVTMRYMRNPGAGSCETQQSSGQVGHVAVPYETEVT